MLKPLLLIKGYCPSPHNTAAPPLTVLQPLPSQYCSPSHQYNSSLNTSAPPLTILQPLPHTLNWQQVSGLNYKMTLEEVGLSPYQAIPLWGCGQPFSWRCGPAIPPWGVVLLMFCFVFTLFTKQEIISCHLLQHIAYEPGLSLHLNVNNSGINVWPWLYIIASH